MLTDSFIRSAPPGTYWDTNPRGFGIRIGKRAKTFLVLIASGRRQVIGPYGVLSLADARAEARRRLAEKVLGKVHPNRAPCDKAIHDFLKAAERANRPRTVKDYRRHLTLYYDYGRRSLTDITPREIARQLEKLADRPGEKEHAFKVGRTFFRWCARQHLIDRSPMEHMQVTVGKSRERILTEDELKALWAATGGPWCAFHSIVRLLVLTGQRRGEIAGLQWDWLDTAERTITIPATVTKNGRTHTFPYGDLVADHIAGVGKMVGCPYLFPASRQRSEATTVFAGWSKSKAALDKASGVTGWTLHDLRRTYSSTMARLGVSQIVTEKLLNHVSGGVQSPISSTYNRYTYMTEMRHAVGAYEGHIRALVG